MAKESTLTALKIEEIRNNPYESGRILCAEQDTCPFYLPWAGPETNDSWTRKRVRCEYLSDLRGLNITLASQKKTEWGCGNVSNLKPGGGYKRVGIIIKPDKEK